MVQIKRLTECTLEEAVTAWNKGFTGYYVDASTTADKFVSRMGQEDLSPSLSVVACIEGRPAGLTLSGLRTIHGRKVAWNGGTCVAPEWRGKGVGEIMIKAALERYEQEGVDTATLEAFVQNESAISLYRKMGYQVVDRLLFLERTGPFTAEPFAQSGEDLYTIRRVTPREVGLLPFYPRLAPWQTQWQSAKEGEGLLVIDQKGAVVGFALYRRVYDEAGAVQAIFLLQCDAHPEVDDADGIIRTALTELFAPYDLSCRRSTFNLPASRQRLVQLLTTAGFQPTVEQVFMTRQS
ncbi:GNAT family N-acetyltransferase [Brevibacillus humidisoli]|uniref:GNAT family N-acetyltransferase n=1 Tax=Brevibacillus humidisoli TaxID=2895522 RepID=UPI001E44B9BE|nr:GNAT family N-acetyltransferase [Brevibacillus humidisoli]UFJ40245.1 GNAT family N-acetyltransferase [Brevibacillus humidisoli]